MRSLFCVRICAVWKNEEIELWGFVVYFQATKIGNFVLLEEHP